MTLVDQKATHSAVGGDKGHRERGQGQGIWKWGVGDDFSRTARFGVTVRGS